MAKKFLITTNAQSEAYFNYTERLSRGEWKELPWHQQPDARPFATLEGPHVAEDYVEVEGKTVVIDHVTGTVYAFEHTAAQQLEHLEAICKEDAQ